MFLVSERGGYFYKIPQNRSFLNLYTDAGFIKRNTRFAAARSRMLSASHSKYSFKYGSRSRIGIINFYTCPTT